MDACWISNALGCCEDKYLGHKNITTQKVRQANTALSPPLAVDVPCLHLVKATSAEVV